MKEVIRHMEQFRCEHGSYSLNNVECSLLINSIKSERFHRLLLLYQQQTEKSKHQQLTKH
jgi:hypothetical protein